MDLKGLKFSKMHGIGNDFVIIDESKATQIPETDKPEACRFLCDRHFGVGADGVLFVVTSNVADIGYRMFNPDGSEAEMCGNGIRCFGNFVYIMSAYIPSGRERSFSLPESLNSSGERRQMGIINRSVLPDSRHPRTASDRGFPPIPLTLSVESSSFLIFAPIAVRTSMVARMSCENARFEITLSPYASAAQMSARCEMLFDGGAVTLPESMEGAIFTLYFSIFLCFFMLDQQVDGFKIAVGAVTRDSCNASLADVADLSEILALRHVRDVDLDRGNADSLEGVEKCHRRVCICRGIDDDAVEFLISLLNSVNKDSLVIALEHFQLDSAFVGVVLYLCK